MACRPGFVRLSAPGGAVAVLARPRADRAAEEPPPMTAPNAGAAAACDGVRAGGGDRGAGRVREGESEAAAPSRPGVIAP